MALPTEISERNPLETDESLMRRCQAGDADAFDALYRRHANRIYAFFIRQTGNPTRSDDLLQITWMHIHRARATWDRAARFVPWLYAIATNARRDEGRKTMRDKADLTSEGTLPERVDLDAQPAIDAKERVRAALLQIPESYREVIVLHRWHDLGFKEIADALGTTEGAVKLRAHRGYLALRAALLQGDLDDAEAPKKSEGSR